MKAIDTSLQPSALDQAGTIIANQAMRVVAMDPRTKAATPAQLDAVIAAMKAAAPAITDQLLSDLKEAPTVSEYATRSAVLALALAGLAVLD